MKSNLEAHLVELVERLKKAYGADLVSVILYGSGASTDFQEKFSDLNIFCALRQVTPRELAAADPVLRWWIKLGHPAPLLMAEEEVARSTDCFPIEFQDMIDRRRVLHGKDVIEGLPVDRSFYRAQVEYELRSKLLRLRQKAASVMHDRDLLLRLMADSVSTFLVLARHAILLKGEQCPASRQETLAKLKPAAGVDEAPFAKLVALRDLPAERKGVDVSVLFEQYLKEVRVLVDAVDRIEK
ncbi:MAG: hypothetical protein U0Q16_30660 [Bryobacteraceae bacterium]